MPKVHFLVHDQADTVGVVVVEGVKAKDQLSGWLMDQNKTIEVQALDDIPIGHKLAIKPMAANGAAIKYGMDIGRTTAGIEVGRHVHIHNLHTRRW